MKLRRHRLPTRRRRRSAFTLMEVMIALTITLILMTSVVQIFKVTSDGVFNSRANMELSDQLRNARHRLIQDLRGTTALTIPPAEPYWGVGYFEYFEGESVAVTGGGPENNLGGAGGGDVGFSPQGPAAGALGNRVVMTEFGDHDDILMFTTASFGEEFVGLSSIGGVYTGVKSKFAEVAWFPRIESDAASADQWQMTLRRRAFLILPRFGGGISYQRYGVSTRVTGGGSSPELSRLSGTSAEQSRWIGNTLEDLSRRINRVLHRTPPLYGALPNTFNNTTGFGFPYRLDWNNYGVVTSVTSGAPFNFRGFSLPGASEQGAANRESEDVILSNVVGFDVKAWDPGAPVFRVVSDDGDSGGGATTDFQQDRVGIVQPGDAGYIRAVNDFISSPGAADRSPVSFGAYADLNYFGRLSVLTGVFSSTSSAYPLTRYLTALNGTTGVSFRRSLNSGLEPPPPLPVPYFAGPGTSLKRPQLLSKGNALQRLITGTDIGSAAGGTLSWSGTTYDTWSKDYEYDGIDNDLDGTIDEGTNGVDDPIYIPQGNRWERNGLIDDPQERDSPAPYEVPLRGIQVKIRVMEPDSKQVREATVVHEFLPL